MRGHGFLMIGLLVIVAGCLGGGGTGTASPTQTPSAAATSTGQLQTIQQRALQAMRAVETYHATERRTLGSPMSQGNTTLRYERAVNRSARRAYQNSTTTTRGSRGKQVTQEVTYIVGGYEYNRSISGGSDWHVQQYDGGWGFHSPDKLDRARFVLNRTVFASVEEVTLNGTRVYRLESATAPQRMESIYDTLTAGATSAYGPANHSVENASVTYWISAETYRPLKVTGSRMIEVSQRFRFPLSFTIRYEYDEPVSITLPEAARKAR